MKIFLMFRQGCGVLLQFLCLPILFSASVCHAQQAEKSVVKKSGAEYVLLGLVGYNYTDRHISEYSVEGASGGHVNLSSPTSGGSGVTCCVKMKKNNLEPIRVKVRWQVDGCLQLESNPRTGATGERRVLYYKETDVDVRTSNGEKLSYIETHFYPDGSVQVKLAEHGSTPLLALDGKRPDKSSFPRCKDGKKSK